MGGQNNDNTLGTRIKWWLSRYTIYQDGIAQEHNLKNWKIALKQARKYTKNLFDDLEHKVEILNTWTGEIVTLEDAETRAKRIKNPSLHTP